MSSRKARPAAIWPIIHITRPQIATQAAIYTALGAYLAQGLRVPNLPTVAVAALVVALIVAFGFVINDYADLEVDRLNRPERPLPMGELSREEALRIAGVLAALAIAVACLLRPALFGIACVNLVLTTAYSLLLKRTVLLGNTAIALLNSSILLFGALAAGAVTPLIWAVAGMSFVYTLAQEVLYTVSDIGGDSAVGIVTTAVYFGVGPSLVLFRALMIMVVLLALIPWWLMARSPLYLVALLVCTVLPVGLLILPLTWRAEPQQVEQACRVVKVVRLTSLLPLLLLPVVS
jgi:geranylgeranylglycerol-phosphate geranylgeranyltransferase